MGKELCEQRSGVLQKEIGSSGKMNSVPKRSIKCCWFIDNSQRAMKVHLRKMYGFKIVWNGYYQSYDFLNFETASHCVALSCLKLTFFYWADAVKCVFVGLLTLPKCYFLTGQAFSCLFKWSEVSYKNSKSDLNIYLWAFRLSQEWKVRFSHWSFWVLSNIKM